MTLATLVTGGSAATREAAIAATVNPAMPTAFLLEGMASGSSGLEKFAARNAMRLVRIAPGCPCCVGNLTLRVTLNRLLRHPPQRLFISLALGLADGMHLERLSAFLTQPPYDALLTWTDPMRCDDVANVT